ncbi:hypothetical protein OUZ56_028008 [Daphnia magna]|uniref:Uncharacterized protein n=1 Tax=Daphnia magna TaxID=35525 RepID=A0ABR0B2L6_9CRUS|nr:hypothetical protein OUZ56_028008 [Daphnia magna]
MVPKPKKLGINILILLETPNINGIENLQKRSFVIGVFWAKKNSENFGVQFGFFLGEIFPNIRDPKGAPTPVMGRGDSIQKSLIITPTPFDRWMTNPSF